MANAFRLLSKRIVAAKALVPNAETIEAMKAARRGDLTSAGTPAELLASLNAPHTLVTPPIPH